MGEQRGGTFGKDIRDLLDMMRQSRLCVRADAGEMLTRLSELIYEWNQRVNLVSRKDIARLVTYHFCDAASLLPVIRTDTDIGMLDVGGSNGLPGLVLSAISPRLAVTVCDSRTKREGFLSEACAALEGRAAYVVDRVDSEGFRRQNAEKFDLIVARAVTGLRLLLKWCLPLAKPGGFIAAYKGSRCTEEVRQAEAYLWSHGVNLVMVIGSPFAAKCNPLRQFAVVGKSR